MAFRQPKIAGIILAAGKGTRLNSHKVNKVCLPFNGQPLITYAAKLMDKVADKTYCVVGAYAESVSAVLSSDAITYVRQNKQLGTAHAVRTAIRAFTSRPQLVLAGYGDHMMFYSPKTIAQLISLHQRKKAVMSLITTTNPKPNKLAWGRIIRDQKGNVVDSREQKDASGKEKKINELNAGFYCFTFNFLEKNIAKVPRSLASGEYYLNGLVEIAAKQGLVVSALKVPFSSVGIGVNNKQELKQSQVLHQETRKENQTKSV